jgi:formylmethanofuran dehydrogenase subunit D
VLLVDKIDVIILTGRTLQQGIGLEVGKVSEEYSKSVNYAEINRGDSIVIGLADGSPVEVTTVRGKVVLHGRISETLPPGLIFVPYGPWVNQVLGPDTHCTGTPQLKGVPAKLELAEGKQVPTLHDLVKIMRGK